MLPTNISVHKGSGKVIVKLTDGKSHCVPRSEVSLRNLFDEFRSNDDFMVIAMNYAIDCILSMQLVTRYKSLIDWLARPVRRRRKFDVSEVCSHLLISPSDWPDVTVVDREYSSPAVHRASDALPPRIREFAF